MTARPCMIEPGGNMTTDMRAVERLLNEANDYGTAAFNACKKGDIEDADKLFAKGQELLAAACDLLGIRIAVELRNTKA
jgi:hypothetical protein